MIENNSVRTMNYSSWEQYKADFTIDLFGDGQFREERYIFRGQASDEWELVSGFDRWYESQNIELSRPEVAKKILVYYQNEIMSFQNTLAERLDENGLLALAQHHGLHTRLLDWTLSPYIAAFFAFQSYLDHRPSDEIESISIYAINLSGKMWNHPDGVEIIRPPSIGNLRLRNQFGLFTMNRTPYRSIEEYVSKFSDVPSALLKIVLPASVYRIALADLTAMGLTASRLFPDHIGAAIAARYRFLLNDVG